MNRTLQLQLVFVGISLLILVIVAFFPPALRVAEVRFEQAHRDSDRIARNEERRRRQQEVDATHPDSGEDPAAGAGQTPARQGPVTEDPREGTGGAPVASDPTPPALGNINRLRPTSPRRTPVPTAGGAEEYDAGDAADETGY